MAGIRVCAHVIAVAFFALAIASCFGSDGSGGALVGSTLAATGTGEER